MLATALCAFCVVKNKLVLPSLTSSVVTVSAETVPFDAFKNPEEDPSLRPPKVGVAFVDMSCTVSRVPLVSCKLTVL